jgi:hypothetical protein
MASAASPDIFRPTPPEVPSLSRDSVQRNSTHGRTSPNDIKHEVMVNYIYQQQCAQLWVRDSSGGFEGVLVKKSKNEYMACPPRLGGSPFAAACAALNLRVTKQLHYKTHQFHC